MTGLKQMLRAVGIGVGGCLILTLFLAALLRLETVAWFGPYIIGFNGCLGGYNLIERSTGAKSWVGPAVTAGVLVAVIGLVAVNVATWQIFGGIISDPSDLWLYPAVGLATGWLGGLISAKNAKVEG